MNFFYGKIENERLQIEKPKAFNIFLEKNEGKEVELQISKKIKHRTDTQNRYYWALLNIISDDTGADVDSLHDTFKAKFLVDRTGKFPVVMSTTKLSTLDFGDYIEKIRMFVADFGISLPSSDEYYEKEFSKLCL